jgi:hypothetical protein
MAVSRDQARAAKLSVKALDVLPADAGVGITKLGADYAVKVNLREPLPKGVSLPEKVDSVSLCVEIVGVITKRR